MKKLIVLVTLLFATASYAEEITIVPAGKPGGSSFARATMYQEVLKKNGHSVKFENISAMTEATKYLEKTRGKENVIIMFASNQPAQMGYFITKKNFVLREYSAPYYWCMSNEAKGKDKLIVGLDKNMNQKFSDAVFKKLGNQPVNDMISVITGKTAIEIVNTLIKYQYISTFQHAADMGIELCKAELALKYNLKYIQDKDLKIR